MGIVRTTYRNHIPGTPSVRELVSVSDGLRFRDTAVGDDGTAAEPFFSDGFESGDLSHTENGFTWSSENRTRVGSVAEGLGYEVRTGTYSLRFRYPAEEPQAEQRFSLGGDYTELWMEYYIHVPSYYNHRDISGQATNNKFLQVNSNTDFHITTEAERQTSQPGSSYMRRFLAASRGVSGAPTSTALTENFIGPGFALEPGTWTQARFHFRTATARDVQDGVAEWFFDGVLFKRLYWDFWANVGSDGGDPGQPAYVRGGYLMGWANSKYPEETHFFIDDFKVYSANPGWGD